jgi:hypothetical protein
MKKPCLTDSTRPSEPVVKSPGVNVPPEFKVFMMLMARSFSGSDSVSTALNQLRKLLTDKHGPEYANAYVYELAQAYASRRSKFMQDFCG